MTFVTSCKDLHRYNFRFLTLNIWNFVVVNYRKAQWWDTNEPYHYIRTEEREDYDVLIVGGNDNPTGIKAERNLDPYGSLEPLPIPSKL
mgnify:CR=1 FL=1